MRHCFADKLPPKYPHPTDSEVISFLNAVGAPEALTVAQVCNCECLFPEQ